MHSMNINAQNSVLPHDLCHRVCKPQLSYLDANDDETYKPDILSLAMRVENQVSG
jgi:hypothetical protein